MATACNKLPQYFHQTQRRLTVFADSLLIFLLSGRMLFAAETAKGYWVVQGRDAVVLITPDKDSINPKIARILEPSLLGQRKSNKTMQSIPFDGQILGQGFTLSDGKLIGGKIYDPSSGNLFKANITNNDADHLLVRGFVAVPFFGQSQTWTRLELFRQNMLEKISMPDDVSALQEIK